MQPNNITPAEMAQIPRWCAESQTFSTQELKTSRWWAIMGRNFLHVHHYCWAMINIRRADRAATPAKQKIALYEEARGDLGYVIFTVDPDFVLLPEFFTWWGYTHLRLNDPRNADAAFARARALKPDYWPAYLRWAEYLHSHGKKTEAMNIVRSGLEHSPGAKPLLLLYQDLGGKAADIPPPSAKSEAPAATPSAESAPNVPLPANTTESQ